MCLIIHSETGDFANFENHLQSTIKKNPHGWGFMALNKGKVLSGKFAKANMADVLAICDRLYHMQSPAFIHFRLATSGEISETLAHPYKVGKGALMHNGILPMKYEPPKNSKLNDTLTFINTHRDILGKIRTNTKAIADIIGRNNKFAWLDSGGPLIVNRDSGIEYKGLWVSNTYAWDYKESLYLDDIGNEDDIYDLILDYPEIAASLLEEAGYSRFDILDRVADEGGGLW